jgi:hypothetical protein
MGSYGRARLHSAPTDGGGCGRQPMAIAMPTVYDLRSDPERFLWLEAGDLPWEMREAYFRTDPMLPAWPTELRLNPLIVETADLAKPLGDHPQWATGIPVFSGTAVEHLRAMLLPAGELLPVHVGEEPYYAFHLLDYIDALDPAASVIERGPTGLVFNIHRYSFRPGAIPPDRIFRIREQRTHLFCGDAVVSRIESVGLKGFVPVQVWTDND